MGWKEFVPFLVLVSVAGLIFSYFDSKYSPQSFKTPLPKASYQPIRLPPPPFPPTHPPTSSIKRILYFTPLFKKKDWGFGIGSEPFEQCPNKNCFVTNKGKPEDFDALLFHERNFNQKVFFCDFCKNNSYFSWFRFPIRVRGDKSRWSLINFWDIFFYKYKKNI